MSETGTHAVQALVERGVRVHAPASVDVAPDVDPARIAPGVVLHAGCRLRGAATSIGPGCALGAEAPLTLENCRLGAGVRLKGGTCTGATFLDRVELGAAAHVRSGTLLEEEASGGHAVGLKQTILLPFVTLGSLVNFCDCLMAGGTSRRNHGEVGSSYVHFNFTPHQDKAAPSLIGDVPRGVMLDQPPVFLGGQGGLVGPARVAYGTVLAAGAILRRDVDRPGRLIVDAGVGTRLDAPYDPVLYGDVSRIVHNNFLFLGNLLALRAWIRTVRTRLEPGDPYRAACRAGAVEAVERGFADRLHRLDQLAEKLGRSVAAAAADPQRNAAAPPYSAQRAFHRAWPAIRDRLTPETGADAGAADRDAFLGALDRQPRASDYLSAVRALPARVKARGTAWLGAMVERVVALEPREAA